jgi:hypothetical protein
VQHGDVLQAKDCTDVSVRSVQHHGVLLHGHTQPPEHAVQRRGDHQLLYRRVSELHGLVLRHLLRDAVRPERRAQPQSRSGWALRWCGNKSMLNGDVSGTGMYGASF